MHLLCIQATFKVTHNFTTVLHAAAVLRANVKTQKVTKRKVLALKLSDEEVIRPDGSLGSLAQYLATLQDADQVTVISQASKHGLTGKLSNNASTAERALFCEFIKEHRAPTGRTQDHSGRYHGAEFYLTSQLTQVKTQSGRDTADPNGCLELVFRKAILGREDAVSRKLKPPSGSSIRIWLDEDFGIKSEHGHTTLFPHKTDACSLCSSFDVDISSTQMFIKRHEQQTGDAGSLERQVPACPSSARARTALPCLQLCPP